MKPLGSNGRMRKGSCVMLLIVFLVSSFVFVSIDIVQAATVPPSIISTDTIWTVASSPYNLSGPTLVSSGVTLTIQAGATINLNSYYLQVNGTLNAVGTSTNPIHINSASVNAGQIRFTASSIGWNQQTSTGCTIQNAIINQTVISINNCSVKISGNTFNDAADMAHENVAITTSGGYSIISNNYFTECRIDISDSSTIFSNVITGGMGLYGGSPVVSNNQISGRSSYFLIGRSFDRDYDTIAIMRGAPVVSNNNISGVIGFNAYEYGDNGIGAFNHALISGNIINEGYVYGVGIDIIAGTGSIDIISNIISDISTGINVSNTIAVLVKIQGNLIVDSNITAISATDNAIIQNNTLANSGTGITLNNAVSPMISGNNIENSNQYIIQLKGTSSNIDAANNWWGTTDTKVISQNIYDQKNDFNLGKVNFTPILNAPNPSAPSVTATKLTPAASPISSASPTSSPTIEESPTNSIATPEFSIMTILILLVVATFTISIAFKKTCKTDHAQFNF